MLERLIKETKCMYEGMEKLEDIVLLSDIDVPQDRLLEQSISEVGLELTMEYVEIKRSITLCGEEHIFVQLKDTFYDDLFKVEKAYYELISK